MTGHLLQSNLIGEWRQNSPLIRGTKTADVFDHILFPDGADTKETV